MKIRKILLALIIGFLLTINVDAANIVKEDDSTYQGATYIIGSTRFDSSHVLSINSIKTAVQNDFILQLDKDLMPQDIEIKTYYKSGFDGAWYEINDEAESGLRALTPSETNELKSNLNIYFVNNEVKEFTYDYSGSINIDTLPDEVSYENGKLTVPANILRFYFETEDGAEVKVTTENIEQDIDEDKEGTLNVDIKPLIDIILPEFLTEDGFYTGEANSVKIKVRVTANSYKHDTREYYLSLSDKDGELNYLNSGSQMDVVLDQDVNEFEFEVYADNAKTIELTAYLDSYEMVDFNVTDNTNITFKDLPYAKIDYLGGLDLIEGSEGDPCTIEKNNITVQDAEISWYPADASVGRLESGNRFGLKITAPEEYRDNLDENIIITRTMYYHNPDNYEEPITETFNMVWGGDNGVADGDGTYYETWPLIKEGLQNIKITIKWNEVNTQTINVDMFAYSLKEAPKAKVSYIAGITQEPSIFKVETNTQVDINGGIVSWYPADSSVGRIEAGNRIGFKIEAPEEYKNNLDENVKITRTMYYNDKEPVVKEMVWGGDNGVADGDGTYYETWPLISSSLYRMVITIEWDSSNIETIEFYMNSFELEIPKAEVSYIAGSSVEPNINVIENNTNINLENSTISWYPADASVGRMEAGNRVGFKIKALDKFTSLLDENLEITRTVYYNDGREPVKKEMVWGGDNGVADGDGTYYETWPLIDTGTSSISIEIKWSETNIQTIYIYLSEINLENPKAEVSYISGSSVEPTINIGENNTDIYIENSTISWYTSDASVGRMEAGNRVGFKIKALDKFTSLLDENLEITRTTCYSDERNCIKKEMVWGGDNGVADGDGTYYETWPLIDFATSSISIEIKWSETNIQTINIYLSNIMLEASPKAEVSYIAGLNDGGQVDKDEYTGDISVYGTVKWYDADPFVGRYESGNRIGFKITAPEEYKDSLDENVKITRTMYYNDGSDPVVKEMVWGGDNGVADGDGTYYETWSLIKEGTEHIEIEIEWEKGNTQKIVIWLYGQLEPKPIQASISYIGGLSVVPKIYGNTILIDEGEVSWYPENSSVNRIEGNRFGFKITAPEIYTYDDYKNVKISRKMYYSDKELETKEMVWGGDNGVADGDGTYYETWPLVTDTLEKVVIEIEWSETNTQVITIHIDDAVTLQANE